MDKRQILRKSTLGALFLAVCGILRSSDLFFRVPALGDLSPLVIITWEHLISLVVLLPMGLLILNEYRLFSYRDLGLFILVGWGASALGIYFFTRAFLFMNPALTILLQKLQPVITISLGVFLLKEKVRKHFWVWSVVAIISSYFVSFSLTNPFSGEWRMLGRGLLYTLLAALFWGSGTVWGKMLLNKYSERFVVFNRYLFGALFAVALTLFSNGSLSFNHIFASEKPLIGPLLYMALIPGMLALVFFYFGLKMIKASVAAIIELVFPLSSVLIMWIFFDRPLDIIQIAASIILVISIMMATHHGRRRKKEAHPQHSS